MKRTRHERKTNCRFDRCRHRLSGSVLNSWLQSRLKLDEATRTERWTAYKKLWTLTKRIPKWPRETQFTYVGLKDFSEKCRDWYFDEGGYHLSKPSRKA